MSAVTTLSSTKMSAYRVSPASPATVAHSKESPPICKVSVPRTTRSLPPSAETAPSSANADAGANDDTWPNDINDIDSASIAQQVKSSAAALLIALMEPPFP